MAPLIAWTYFVPLRFALPAALLVWGATAHRVQRLLSDPPRPRWVVRWLDEPMFWHWGGGVLALPLTLLCGVVAVGLGLAGCSAAPATGSWPPSGVASLGFALALLTSGYGIWVRRRFVRVRTISVTIPGLAPGFDGYRIAHVSDLHIGSHDDRSRGLEWAGRVSALRADLVAVTGDLVTSGTAYYADAAEVVASFHGNDGVYVVMGNHDQWNNDALTREVEARGPRVLKNESVVLERGSARLVIAGVDDAYTDKDDIDRTLAGRPAGVPTVLLAHYPDFFRHAARHGVELTLSGHTHGGQFGLPFWADRLNLAVALGQRARGLLAVGRHQSYVNAGLGTTGPPIRLGVAPEIAVIVLRCPGSEMPPGLANVPTTIVTTSE